MRHLVIIASAGLFIFFTGCNSDSSDSSSSYVQTLNYQCSQSGGTVSSSGRNNCDYEAKISTSTGSTISSSDSTSATAISNQNAATSQACEYAAELKNIECKY